MGSNSELVHKALEEVATGTMKKPQPVYHWVEFTSLPEPFPREAEGLLIFSPSGGKVLFLGWHGWASHKLLCPPGTSVPPLVGVMADGRRVQVTSRFSNDERLIYGQEDVQVCGVHPTVITMGEPSAKASQAKFRLINFRMGTFRAPRKTRAGWSRERPFLWFRAGDLSVVIRAVSQPPEELQEYEYGSELQLDVQRPVSPKELGTRGWHVIKLLGLAAARDVGYQDITFRHADREWTVAHDSRFLPVRQSQFKTNIGLPLSRKYLPRLVKKGLPRMVDADNRYGVFLVLRHYIEAQHTQELRKTLTCLFQGYEACCAAYRANQQPTIVRPDRWAQALKYLTQARVPLSVKKALGRMKLQVRNEPTARETLGMILKELRLTARLGFWRQRQAMFHRGDIDREHPVEGHVDDMIEADELLARMLLRMVGYSGQMWRSVNRHMDIGTVP